MAAGSKDSKDKGSTIKKIVIILIAIAIFAIVVNYVFPNLFPSAGTSIIPFTGLDIVTTDQITPGNPFAEIPGEGAFKVENPFEVRNPFE